MEKYIVPISDTSSLATIATNAAENITLYYEGTNIFTSLEVSSIGEVDIGSSVEYDLISRFEANTTSFIDSDTDLDSNFYLYRLTYVSGNDSAYSNYILAGKILTQTGYDSELAELLGSTIDRVGSIYRVGKTKTMLYKESDSGIIVEKGIAMNHATPRYRGPIELSKERAIRTALLGTYEYVTALSTEIESEIVNLLDSLNSLWNLTISGIP
jgi:hypothetical protein